LIYEYQIVGRVRFRGRVTIDTMSTAKASGAASARRYRADRAGERRGVSPPVLNRSRCRRTGGLTPRRSPKRDGPLLVGIRFRSRTDPLGGCPLTNDRVD
jgi:hypothetical protein